MMATSLPPSTRSLGSEAAVDGISVTSGASACSAAATSAAASGVFFGSATQTAVRENGSSKGAPFWQDYGDLPATPENFARLLKNEIAAIRVPAFITQAQCALIMDAAHQSGLDYYENVSPPIGKLGITQFEHGPDVNGREQYLSKVQHANRLHELLSGRFGFEPLKQMLALLRGMGAKNVRVACEPDGRQYFAGLVREMGADGALLHFDFAPFDAGSAWAIGQVQQQLAVNIYLSELPAGGECLVYNRQWQPRDEASKIRGSYGYHKSLVDGAQVKVLVPRPGDLTVFNSRNFHEVRSLIATAEHKLSDIVRFTISFFVGKIDDDNFVIWS